MVTHSGILDCQVCVPAGWTDEQVKAFADSANPCGTSLGWHVRKQADYREDLQDRQLERVACSGAQGRPGYVHVMLDA